MSVARMRRCKAKRPCDRAPYRSRTIPTSEGANDRPMWETRAVDLRLNLPQAVAAELEEVQRNDPEMLSRLVTYAVARRRIYEHLARRSEAREGSDLTDERSGSYG